MLDGPDLDRTIREHALVVALLECILTVHRVLPHRPCRALVIRLGRFSTEA
jgi:hypothetical protein